MTIDEGNYQQYAGILPDYMCTGTQVWWAFAHVRLLIYDQYNSITTAGCFHHLTVCLFSSHLGFCHSPLNFCAYFCAYQRLLPLIPAYAQISKGEWQKPPCVFWDKLVKQTPRSASHLSSGAHSQSWEQPVKQSFTLYSFPWCIMENISI